MVHDRASALSTSPSASSPPPPPPLQLLQATVTSQFEQLRTKELNEQLAQHQISDLQLAREREQAEARERIQKIEEMAEREKQRILKHLEDEKRFTRDIIDKSETMIEQLKRELSSERQRKTEEQKTHDSLRDIYKKISPRQSRPLTKTTRSNENNQDDDDDDDDDRSHMDGETTVYHKDDPLLASTPRDRSLLVPRNDSSDYTSLRQQLEEQMQDDHEGSHDDSGLHLKSNLRKDSHRSSLPPTTPKRRTSSSQPSNKNRIDHLTSRERKYRAD